MLRSMFFEFGFHANLFVYFALFVCWFFVCFLFVCLFVCCSCCFYPVNITCTVCVDGFLLALEDYGQEFDECFAA